MRGFALSLLVTAVLSTGALAAIPGRPCDAPLVSTLQETDVGHGVLIGDVPIVADMLNGLQDTPQAPAATPPAPPASPPGATAPPATQVADHADGGMIVCRYTEIVGSHLRSLLCLSKRRWDRMHHDGRRFMGEYD